MEPFPDLSQPDSAFVPYPFEGQDARLTVQMGDVYLKILDLPDLIDMARSAVVNKAEEAARKNQGTFAGPVVLDLPCTFFMLRSLRSAPDS